MSALFADNFKPELPQYPATADDFQYREAELNIASSNDVELNAVVWHPATETPFCYGFAINNSPVLSEVALTSAWQKEMLIALQCLESQFERLVRELTDCFGDNHYERP